MESSHNTPSLFDVVKQYDSIKVDDYQRTYAWGRDEISELFEDLKDCVDSEDYHFFGTLIFQSETNNLATIVDGQQRLTTIFVLMATLRDEIDRLGIDTLKTNANRRLPIPVINKAWEFLYFNLDPTKPRFRSNRFLEAIFEKSVYADINSQSKILDRESALTLAFRKAVKTIRQLVKEDLEKVFSQEEKLERINSFIDAIRERFLVLRVSTYSLSESLEIFLTLNNRGLPLGASDLVRGDILAKLGEGETEQAQAQLHKQIFEEWSDIADNVKEVEVFLRHWLVATGKGKVQKKKVFDTVSMRLRDATGEGRKEKARTLWKDLQDASEIYNQIIAPKMGGDTQYQLELLHGLMKSHRILLLSVLGATVTQAEREAVVRQVFVLAFRWVIAGGNAQKLEDLFQKWGTDFKASGDVNQLIQALTDEAASINPESVTRYLSEDGDEGFIGKAVLHCINRARTPGANAIQLDSELHLEHIAPQTENDEWKAAVFSGNAELYSGYESAISEIGNLTLLDFKINMSLKQKGFDKKKIRYGDSVIKLTNDLLFLNKWSEVEIQDRTQYIIESFAIAFSVAPATERVKSFEAWLADYRSKN
jgi:hypothetical protein